MIKQITIILFVLLCNKVVGQSFKQQFNDLVTKQDTIGQLKILQEWEVKEPNNPELFIAYFNFYVRKSKMEVLSLDKEPKGTDFLEIKDLDSTKEDPIAYISGDTYYKPYLLNKGLTYIDSGIKKNPSRLDMRFGKIYMLGKVKDYKNFTKEILKVIDHASLINNKWLWTDNEPLQDPKEFMLGSIQEYVYQIYDTGDDKLLDNMKDISERVLSYYPNHVESLSNISVVYLLRKDYTKALEALLKAEKLAPKDYIVLGNIAQAYKLQGDKKNAIKYYELVIKYCEDDSKDYAKEQIRELKKK